VRYHAVAIMLVMRRRSSLPLLGKIFSPSARVLSTAASRRGFSTSSLPDIDVADALRTESERIEADMAGATKGPFHKIGSSSPWAGDPWDTVFEAQVDAAPLLMDSPAALAIPETEADRLALPSERAILDEYEQRLQQRSSRHLGYPYNLVYDHEDLHRFLRYSINNLGDPFVSSNYGVHSREFEVAVIDFFAKMWKIEQNEYWGYVTTCGTEGNLHAMLLARECHPDGVLYTSTETHYSIFKAARYYKMDCEAVPTLPMGEIDYDELGRRLAANKGRSAILNVNIGTTVKGAVDNLDRVLRVLQREGYERENFHVHCDGALFAMMLPFVEYAPQVSFERPIDSIAVSGHKMLGSPMPCGVTLTRKEHVKKVEMRIDYLNSVDTTIMGSRNGQAALFMWHALRRKGVQGITKEVRACLETAGYLRDQLRAHGLACRLNDLSSTVVLERPADENFVQRWQLACEEDIAHVVVMPNVTREKVDVFVAEIVASAAAHGRTTPVRDDSPLAMLADRAWGGDLLVNS